MVQKSSAQDEGLHHSYKAPAERRDKETGGFAVALAKKVKPISPVA
jgi:hypothetical protein